MTATAPTPEPISLSGFERELFTLPGRAEVYVQWKGTDVCLDIWCECGAQSHLDGYVFGRWTCGACGKTFQLAWTATAYEVEPMSHTVIAEPEEINEVVPPAGANRAQLSSLEK